jgi:hypothetical protein
MRRLIPNFNTRPLAYADFLAVCGQLGILVEEKPYLFDEYLSRWGRRPKIIINAGLTPLYRAFVGFHALGHWVAHPGGRDFYLGSPGWLDKTELEASALGYLAVAPHPGGPPYPVLERAHIEGDMMLFWVNYPELQPTGRVVWRRRQTHLQRYMGQLELEF